MAFGGRGIQVNLYDPRMNCANSLAEWDDGEFTPLDPEERGRRIARWEAWLATPDGWGERHLPIDYGRGDSELRFGDDQYHSPNRDESWASGVVGRSGDYKYPIWEEPGQGANS